MIKLLSLVATLLVSSTAFAGNKYISDADDQYLAPIQAYDEIRGKCYPEKLERDDPDPIQYVEIIFATILITGGYPLP